MEMTLWHSAKDDGSDRMCETWICVIRTGLRHALEGEVLNIVFPKSLGRQGVFRAPGWGGQQVGCLAGLSLDKPCPTDCSWQISFQDRPGRGAGWPGYNRLLQGSKCAALYEMKSGSPLKTTEEIAENCQDFVHLEVILGAVYSLRKGNKESVN